MRRRWTAAAIALAVATATGCAADAEQALPEGVDVQFVQLRSDVADRTAQVQIINGSALDLRISRVEFVDDRFDGPALRDRVSVIAAGRTVDLRIALPPSACGGEPADRESRVLIEYETDAGAYVSTVALPDPLGVIPGLHERECLRHDLEAAASLGFTAFEPSPAGAPAVLELTVTPTGEAEAEVGAIQTTNLLTFDASPAAEDAFALDVSVAGGSTEPVVVALPLVPLRCDPHAVQEDKRGTVFSIEVSLDEKAGVIEVPVPGDIRGAILAWVGRWCGFGG